MVFIAMTTNKIQPNKCEFIIVDKWGQPLLFEPTTLDVYDMDGTTTPFVFDAGSYTVFTSLNSVKETVSIWEDLMENLD
jgi:hypothetical protein